MKERTTIPKRVKGTVLFTVVAVMMVMIVFLAGTLALATTASNRAYSNYQKVQTEAIARAVLDGVNRSISEDSSTHGIREQIYNSTTASPAEIPVTMSDNPDHPYTVLARPTGESQWVYNEGSTTPWAEYKIYELTVTVDKTLAETTYSAYTALLRDEVGHMEAEYDTSGESNDDPGGGAFVSMGGTSVIATGGHITGGTYIGIDTDGSGVYTIANNDVEIDSPFYVKGSANTGGGDYLRFHFSKLGDFFAIEGDLNENQADQLELSYADFQWGTATSMKYKETPYIYVGGNFGMTSASKTIGTEDIPTNVYCGSINGLSNLQLYGDLYTFDETATSQLGSQSADSDLYRWSKASFTVTDVPAGITAYGNWFSKGDAIVYTNDGVVINGDLRCDGNLTLKGTSGQKITVHGDIVCSNRLTVTGITVECDGSIYANDMVSSAMNSKATNIYANTIHGSTWTATNVYGATDDTTIAFTEDREWYTDVNWNMTTSNLSYDDSSEPYRYSFDYEVTYTANKHVEVNGVAQPVQAVSGVVTSGTKESAENYNFWWNPPAGNPATYANDQKNSLIDAAKNTTLGKKLTAGEPSQVSYSFGKYNGSISPLSTDALTVYGKPVYPTDYTAANVKTTVGITQPQTTDYTRFYKTETDISTVTGVSSLVNKYTDKGGYYEITGSCYLKDVTFDKNVYVNPSDDASIVIENCSMTKGANFIVDESSKAVKFYVIGTLNLPDTNGIFTKKYWDLLVGDSTYSNTNVTGSISTTTTMPAIKATYDSVAASGNLIPNLKIFSVPTTAYPQSALVLGGNESIVTALIQAPQMRFSQTMAVHTFPAVNYTNSAGAAETFGGGGKNSAIGVIGQLIAADISLPSTNGWNMIYVSVKSSEDDGDGDGGGGGLHRRKIGEHWVVDGVTTDANVIYFNNF